MFDHISLLGAIQVFGSDGSYWSFERSL